jgi:hypothetical protein
MRKSSTQKAPQGLAGSTDKTLTFKELMEIRLLSNLVQRACELEPEIAVVCSDS